MLLKNVVINYESNFKVKDTTKSVKLNKMRTAMCFLYHC